MKLKSFLYTGLFASGCALLALSCTKKADTLQAVEIKDLSNKAMVQVYNAAVSSGGSLINVDNSPVNGATALTYGSAFPASTYFVSEPGLRSFFIKPSSASSVQLPVAFSENFQASRYYNIFIFDTLTAARQITVPTEIEIPSDTTARVRFANFIYSAAAVPAVDIFSVKRQANVFTNVSATEVTGFIPFASNTSDTLIVRSTGTTTSLAELKGFNPTRKRSYTVVFRGRYQSTSGTIARTLSSFANY